ncbi:hypothetical protein, partial [uncultured Rikenella sp.]|uniref:hypothetical protein n=1 Tax=uncultured Rikenella sp. TaxID=368003 RepID=UPI002631AE3A
MFALPSLAASVVNKKNPKKLQSASLRDALAGSARLVGLDFPAGALIMGENPTRAAPENHSPTKQGGENPWSAHRDDL